MSSVSLLHLLLSTSTVCLPSTDSCLSKGSCPGETSREPYLLHARGIPPRPRPTAPEASLIATLEERKARPLPCLALPCLALPACTALALTHRTAPLAGLDSTSPTSLSLALSSLLPLLLLTSLGIFPSTATHFAGNLATDTHSVVDVRADILTPPSHRCILSQSRQSR